MPSVTQASMSSARTPRTMSSTRSNASPSFTSRQAAPMQKRVAPASLASRRLGQHLVDVESLFALQPRALGVMGRLRAIFAVLRAGPGLDRIEAGKLHRAVGVMAAVHLPRLIDQLEQRLGQKGHDLAFLPIVAEAASREADSPAVFAGFSLPLIGSGKVGSSVTSVAMRLLSGLSPSLIQD